MVRRRAIALLLSRSVGGLHGRSDRVAARPASAARRGRPPSDSLKTPSGLSTRVLRPGTGRRHPRPTDTVIVHYTGWTTDGKMFDSSIPRGQPDEFRLDGVISGWTEGVQMMVEGEQRRLWIPEQLAYRGDDPKGMLVFDIELIEIR
jgi:FKBP-type peptidyl-prolyl cis-trans isomerase